jgi:hypothetical protein
MNNFILEKYCKENDLNFNNIFLPNKKNIFFVNILDNQEWNIIDFSWHQVSSHPSYYIISKKSPKKSAFKDSYGENFYKDYHKESYWNQIEYDLTFYIRSLNIDYKKIIKHKYEVKIIAWNFFSYCMSSWFNFKNNKDGISENYFFDFFQLKSYEHEVDKLLIGIKNNHKIIYDYWENFFESDLLVNYSYWSYDYLKKIFETNIISTKIYYTY